MIARIHADSEPIAGFRIDPIVERRVLVELKATGIEVGLLLAPGGRVQPAPEQLGEKGHGNPRHERHQDHRK